MCRGCVGIVSDEVFALQVGFYEEEDVIGAFSDAALPVLDRAEGDAAADVAESCLRKTGSFTERLQSLGDRRDDGYTDAGFEFCVCHFVPLSAGDLPPPLGF